MNYHEQELIRFVSMICALMLAATGVALFLGSIFGFGRPQSFSDLIGYMVVIVTGIGWYILERRAAMREMGRQKRR